MFPFRSEIQLIGWFPFEIKTYGVDMKSYLWNSIKRKKAFFRVILPLFFCLEFSRDMFLIYWFFPIGQLQPWAIDWPTEKPTMTKAFKLNWHRSVPEELQKGTFVDRWTEVSEIGLQTLNLTYSCGQSDCSKTALITSSVHGAGVNPPPKKIN